MCYYFDGSERSKKEERADERTNQTVSTETGSEDGTSPQNRNGDGRRVLSGDACGGLAPSQRVSAVLTARPRFCKTAGLFLYLFIL